LSFLTCVGHEPGLVPGFILRSRMDLRGFETRSSRITHKPPLQVI